MSALVRSLLSTTFLSAALILTGSALTGCANSDRPACNVTADCEGANICEAGYCEPVPEECLVHADCEGDMECQDLICVAPSGDGEEELDAGPDTDPEPDTATDPEPDTGPDAEEDFNPGSPIIESVTPADSATDIALDTDIRVRFDRPIAHEFGALSNDGVFLASPEGVKLDASLEYLEDEREVILTPNEPLWKGTRYTINVTEFIRDISGNHSLQNQWESDFTTAYELDGDLTALAELFAPTIYQETRLTDKPEIHSDIPTRVDFDGDFNGSNNKSASNQNSANPSAHVYYSVLSTETHHFLQYILYYPSRRLGSGGATTYHEHSFTGFVMAVTRDELEVELIEGVHTGLSNIEDSTLTFRPVGSTVSGRNNTHESKVMEFDAQYIDDGSFPLYVSSGDHAACFWHDRNTSFWPSACHEVPEEFLGGEGLVLTPGSAQTFDEAVDGEEIAAHRTMTYELIPFVEPFWTSRGDFDCGLFSQIGFSYSPSNAAPDGHTPVEGPGDEALFLPRSLCSNDTDSYGNLPYRWFGADAGSNGGEWFLDPAMALNNRFDFEDDGAKEFSLDYCDHFYFNINRSDETACGGAE